MSDPFLGEIKLCAFTYAPRGWALCDGRTMTISQNNALYSLLSTTFGGDGKTYFNLPDLRGKTTIHIDAANSLKQGNNGADERVTLTTSQIPSHTHTLNAVNTVATANVPTGLMLAQSPASTAPNLYQTPPQALINLNTGSILNDGGSAPHNNIQPTLVLNYCIALTGIYPPRS